MLVCVLEISTSRLGALCDLARCVLTAHRALYYTRIAMSRKLSKVVMIRVTYQDAVALRRWARTQGSDVSKVIRSFIDQRRIEEQRHDEGVEGAQEEVEGGEGRGAGREEGQREDIAA